MIIAALQEMLLPLVVALVLLAIADVAMRRWIQGPTNDMRNAVRAHVARGSSAARASRESRVPHDVVNLAIYVEQRRQGVRPAGEQVARRAGRAASTAAGGN